MKVGPFDLKPFLYLFSVVLILCFCFDTTRETLKNPAIFFALAALLIVFFTMRGRMARSYETERRRTLCG